MFSICLERLLNFSTKYQPGSGIWGISKIFREKVGIFGCNVHVTASEPGTLLRCRTGFLFGLMHVDICNRFEPAGLGTRFHIRLDFSIRRVDRLLGPILERRIAKPDPLHLETLKQFLEQ